MSNDVSYNNFLRPEILAPAGNIEKLIFACKYGADAVYVGGGSYSLRSGSGFSIEDLYKARKITNELNKKLYVAINIFAHNEDIDSMEAYLHEIKSVHPDALLVSDPGVFDLCQHCARQASRAPY